MDSTKIKNSFAESDVNKYGTHNIELISDKVTFDNNIGKFIMTYINPNISTGIATDTTFPKNSGSNVINKDKTNLGISNVTTSNYVELKIPKHLFYITDIQITPNTVKGEEGITSCSPKAVIIRKEYIKGQKFIIVNSNADYNNPVIVGVVEEG